MLHFDSQRLKWLLFSLALLLPSEKILAEDATEHSDSMDKLYQGAFARFPMARSDVAKVIGRPLAYDGFSGINMWKSTPFHTADGYLIERIEARSRDKVEDVQLAYVAIHVASTPCFSVGTALPMLGDNTFLRDPNVGITYYVHRTTWGTISMGVPDATPDCVTNVIGTSFPASP